VGAEGDLGERKPRRFSAEAYTILLSADFLLYINENNEIIEEKMFANP